MQVTWTHLVNLWFERNRGLALALVLSGTGLPRRSAFGRDLGRTAMELAGGLRAARRAAGRPGAAAGTALDGDAGTPRRCRRHAESSEAAAQRQRLSFRRRPASPAASGA